MTKTTNNQRMHPDQNVIRVIKRLNGWKMLGRELTKAFHLRDFSDAVSFINDVADIANSMDHHPDVLLSEFRNVRLFIKTNELAKVTMLDVDFAKRVDHAFEKRKSTRK